METNEFIETDILVCGAGVAGLLLARELGKKYRVVLLESKRKIPSNKYWLCPSDTVMKHKDLSKYVDINYDSMVFKAYDDTILVIRGSYDLFDTEKLLNGLVKDVRDSGSLILLETPFYSFQGDDNAFIAYAGNHKISSRLCIDCMGYSSPIVNSLNLVNIFGYYSLYGRHVSLKRSTEAIALHNVAIEKTPVYFELFPRNDMTAYAVAIVSDAVVANNLNLKNVFNFIINNTIYSDIVDHVIEESEELEGIIPVGRINRNPLDQLFIYGESGQNHPGASATALTEYLDHINSLVEFLTIRLENNQLTSRFLQVPRSQDSAFKDEFQKRLFLELMRCDSYKFKRILSNLNHFDNSFINHLVFNRLNKSHLLSAGNLIKTVKHRAGYLMRPALGAIFHFHSP